MKLSFVTPLSRAILASTQQRQPPKQEANSEERCGKQLSPHAHCYLALHPCCSPDDSTSQPCGALRHGTEWGPYQLHPRIRNGYVADRGRGRATRSPCPTLVPRCPQAPSFRLGRQLGEAQKLRQTERLQWSLSFSVGVPGSGAPGLCRRSGQRQSPKTARLTDRRGVC